MRIVRVNFKVDGTDGEYYFDRTFDEKLDEQENCDNLLNQLVSFVKNGEPIAALRTIGKDKIKPAILNAANITELLIENVAVYTTAEAKPDAEAK